MEKKPVYIIVNKNTGHPWNNRIYGSLGAVKVARFYMPKHVVERYRVYRLQFTDDAEPVVHYAELGSV